MEAGQVWMENKRSASFPRAFEVSRDVWQRCQDADEYIEHGMYSATGGRLDLSQQKS